MAAAAAELSEARATIRIPHSGVYRGVGFWSECCWGDCIGESRESVSSSSKGACSIVD